MKCPLRIALCKKSPYNLINVLGLFQSFCNHGIFIMLKGLFHPACLASVVSWFAFVVAIFMAHENGDKQRPAKRRHVQGMLDETDPLSLPILLVLVPQREKSPKYFVLSALNRNVNLSNLLSTLGAMNFLKWELFSVSPGI